MAKKKKLTKGQVRRVRSNQKRKLAKEDSVQWEESMLGATQKGLVITRFGQHADIEDAESGEICLLYTSPSPRDRFLSRMPSSA